MVLISMVQVVWDFGLVNYLIQCKEFVCEDVGSVLGLLLLLGGGFFVGIGVVVFWIVQFYCDESLVYIVRIILINFLILFFNFIFIVLLWCDMCFDVLMCINVLVVVVGIFMMLGLVWVGVGFVSLVWGEIGSSLIIVSGVSLVGVWGCLVWFQLSCWCDILCFGGFVIVVNVVILVFMDINDLVVGKMLSFGQVVIVSCVQGLMNLFVCDIMGMVCFVVYLVFL